VPEEVSSALVKELATGSKGELSGSSAGTIPERTSRPNRKPQKPSKLMKPAEAAKARYIPVVAIVNGRTSRTTLVPAGDGRYRLQINTALRKAAHADVGDVVSVELRLDLESRDLPVPADLHAALREHPKARKAFETLATGHRRQFIKWFDSAKAPETRARRVTRAMDILLERAILGAARSRKPKSKSA